MVSLLEKSTRYLPLGLPLPGSLLFPAFGSSSHLLSAPRLYRYSLPFFSFLSFPVFIFHRKPLLLSAPYHVPSGRPIPLIPGVVRRLYIKQTKTAFFSLRGGLQNPFLELSFSLIGCFHSYIFHGGL